MSKNKSIFTVAWMFSWILLAFVQGKAQNNPPLNVETMLGYDGSRTQILAHKKLASVPKLGFFTVTNLMRDWKNKPLVDIMHQGGITYSLATSLDIMPGYHYTAVTGMRPSLALMYTKLGKNWLAVVVPRIDLTDDTNYEVFASAQYNPPLKNKDQWRFYSRVQGLYVMSTNGSTHQRSYIMGRVGFGYKEFAFGLGADFDYFGPMREFYNNAGLFIAADLF